MHQEYTHTRPVPKKCPLKVRYMKGPWTIFLWCVCGNKKEHATRAAEAMLGRPTSPARSSRDSEHKNSLEFPQAHPSERERLTLG